MKNQILFLISLVLVMPAAAQTPSLTDQGNLNNGGTAANCSHYFEFRLNCRAELVVLKSNSNSELQRSAADPIKKSD